MIPLQSTEPVKKFPRLTTAIVLSLALVELLSRLLPGERVDFLLRWAWIPSETFRLRNLAACVVFPHFFAFATQALFIWVFTPKLFERRGAVFAVLCAISGAAVAVSTFSMIYPHSLAPMLLGESIVGAWLGAYMRRDIWGTVNTLVIGPGWIRVLEVPSYVQLFFWFFYQLISNLFLKQPFSDAPMLYWLGFVSFIWGFLLDSLWGLLFAHRNSTTQNHS